MPLVLHEKQMDISAPGEKHIQSASVVYYDPAFVRLQLPASSQSASGRRGPRSNRVALHLQGDKLRTIKHLIPFQQ